MARVTRFPCVRMLPAATNVLGGGGSSNGGWLGLARSMRSEMESRLMLSVRAARPERRGPYAHAPQSLGTLGHVANGVVAVTSHWADGSRHLPLGVKPYRPASRLPTGRKDPAFHTKPELAWELIAEARAAGIPFRLVVADSVYGESAQLEARLYAAHLPYVMGLRPSHGTWQEVQDEAHPPAFTPAHAAARLPPAAWQRTAPPDR